MLLLDRIVTDDFGKDLQAFESCVFKYLLDRLHHGNATAFRSALYSATQDNTVKTDVPLMMAAKRSLRSATISEKNLTNRTLIPRKEAKRKSKFLKSG